MQLGGKILYCAERELLVFRAIFYKECCCVWEAVLFINDKKPIEGSKKRESLQEDCRAWRQARSMLIIQSLGFAKGCKFPCVWNLNFLIVIFWVWFPWRDFTFREFSKGFPLLYQISVFDWFIAFGYIWWICCLHLFNPLLVVVWSLVCF